MGSLKTLLACLLIAVVSETGETACANRRPHCWQVLQATPENCTQSPEFAQQNCRHACGFCQPDDTPRCRIQTGSNDLALVRPHGQQTVARGEVVQYACRAGYVLSEGQLTLACWQTGHFAGTLPACNNPEHLIQESNDVELMERSHTITEELAYTSVGTRLAIEREGVLKQWKFYSLQKGISLFQVWRPSPQGGAHRFNLIGQSQVLTTGQGEETYDLDEADWVTVQPGDRIGLSEPTFYRGSIPYSLCNKRTKPEDFGVTRASASHGDFSPSRPHSFSGDVECMTFSFKAVIHPLSSVPATPDMPTSSVALVSRYEMGSRETVYLGDSSNFYIPVDGYVKEWQFYALQGGTGAFQVWRRVGVIGEWKYQLIGQNEVSITNNEVPLHKLKIPVQERIAVKEGDIIGFLYGENPLGIPYSFCDPQVYPESSNISWFHPLTPDTTNKDITYQFSVMGGKYLCRVFSFRAIVKQASNRPDDLHVNDVPIISRPYEGNDSTAYMGDSSNYHIPTDGYVKEWHFFSRHAGSGAFQVWRRRADQGQRKYQLIGQNEVSITSESASPHHISVKENERISVKAGDIIGFHFGQDRLGVPFSFCSSEQKAVSSNVYWLRPVTPGEMNIDQVYDFSYTAGRYFCRVFSFKAVVEQE